VRLPEAILCAFFCRPLYLPEAKALLRSTKPTIVTFAQHSRIGKLGCILLTGGRKKTCGVPTRSQAHAAFADAQI
jgi:hypothetical protein